MKKIQQHPDKAQAGAGAGPFRTLLENMREGYANCRMLFAQGVPQDFVCLEVNGAFERQTGLKAVAGKKASEVIPGIQESNPELFQICGRVALGGQPEKFETYVPALRIWLSFAVYSTKQGHFVAVLDNLTERKRVAEALRESEAKYTMLFGAAPVWIALTDMADGTYLEVNEQVLRVSGFSREEVIGRTSVGIGWIRPEDRARLLQAIQEQGRIISLEMEFNAKDGRALHGLVNGEQILINGRPCLLTVTVDITERKLAEAAVLRLSLRNQTLLQTASDGIHVLDTRGFVVEANAAFCNHLGYSREEVGRLNVSDWDMRWSRDELLPKIEELILRPATFETRHRRKDGTLREVEISAAGVILEGRKYLYASARDITERKRETEDLRLQGAALNAAANAIIITDREGTVVWANAAFTKLSGYTLVEATGRNPRDLVKSGTQDVHLYEEMWANILAGKVWHGELVNRRKDGTNYPEEMTITPVREAGGKITHYVAIKQDLTVRRQAELALRESELQLRESQTIAGLGSFLLDIASGRWSSSEVLDRVLGIDQDYDHTVAGWLALVHPDDRTMMSDYLADEVLGRGQIFYKEYRIIRLSDKVERWVDGIGKLEFDAAGRAIRMRGTIQDITERKHAEGVLRQEEALFKSLANSIPDEIYFKDRQSRFVRINEAMARHFGLGQPDEAVGRTVSAFFDEAHARQTFADEQRMMETGEPMIGVEEKETWPDGHVTWVSTTKVPLRDPQGVITGLIGISRDITERKSLEAQFLHAQRMEAIGTLAGGVAHDLNNILAPILMVAGILKLRGNTSAQDLELLSLIENSGQRGAGIIRQLLTFSRGISGERVTMQFKHLVHEMAKIMSETFPRNITLVETVPSGLWFVAADPTQMHQVIMNLCVNARDAMPAGGTLTLEAANVTVRENAVNDTALPAGRYVMLSVTDTGQGIPPEVRQRIFEPFFTTKEVGKGTGLGLSTVASIIKSHDGVVQVESEPGRFTAFRVYLPALVDGAATGSVPSLDAITRGQEELILVVDDEEPIREATKSLLQKIGYRVVMADSGETAVRMFIEHQQEVSLVLTDIMLPGMDGLDLIRALRVLVPGMPLVAMSGLDSSTYHVELTALGRVVLLPKPFTPQELGEAVNASLVRKPSPA